VRHLNSAFFSSISG